MVKEIIFNSKMYLKNELIKLKCVYFKHLISYNNIIEFVINKEYLLIRNTLLSSIFSFIYFIKLKRYSLILLLVYCLSKIT